MGHKKQQSEMKNTEPGKHSSKPSSPEIGGREFGQATGPLQSEMARENDGLTDSSAAHPRENEKKMPRKGRKAA